jgi:hypothetical protein
MTKLLDRAISRLRELPEERQDELAEVMLGLAEEPEAILTEDQVAEVELAMREVGEGKIASAERMASLWRRFGL